MMKKGVKIIKVLGILSITLIAIILLSDMLTILISHNRSYNLLKYIPKNEVGVVLGTSKYLADGRLNLFYIYRIQAVKELYNNGKIKKIIVSGDNSTADYDETTAMKSDLLEGGIPVEDIYKDYAGFRTLDSVVRTKNIFGQSKFTIISQEFHVQRAITIAKFYGIDAVGYEAQGVPVRISPRVWIRERGARVKMWMDIVIRKQPKFLGKKIDMTVPQEEEK